jgi:hypothetical protein
MISASKNTNSFVGNLINKAVLIVDSLGPASSQLMFERLRLADTPERI